MAMINPKLKQQIQNNRNDVSIKEAYHTYRDIKTKLYGKDADKVVAHQSYQRLLDIFPSLDSTQIEQKQKVKDKLYKNKIL